MRLSGHIVRMADERKPKQLYYGEPAEGKRNRCKPKKRLKDDIGTTMKSLAMEPKAIKTHVSDRSGWKTKVWCEVKAFEKDRMTYARLKRDLKKNVTIEK
ncbi:Hypothetical predicted protein [Octopus vulgaris]|uniref:Uncharacterized protein n=1 Tax=Octopus vulgaris TaxID=6645 RepID=A0AA36BA53_OCTVU|nr:Hypothetical predicted protein [Octopus vulgaris]